MKLFFINFFLAVCFVLSVYGFPDEGKWDIRLDNQDNQFWKAKTLFKNSQIVLNVNCEDNNNMVNLTIYFGVVRSICLNYDEAANILRYASEHNNATGSTYIYVKDFRCSDHIVIEPTALAKNEKSLQSSQPVYVTDSDGMYVLFFQAGNGSKQKFSMHVHLEMKSSYGYLSAADWPYLPFYGCMCVFYVLLGIIWLGLSFMQWRDLLRVQFWIGGVILLGMLEKATFYAEYQSINTTGVRVQGAILFAEWISCAKRTLARMLVIIVSLGFGITKPRLGASFHRVVGLGLLYFFLAASEAYLRITQPQNESAKGLFVASIPLAVIDSAICWWIFSALVNTTRTLRLRRNDVKLTLYKHFTNMLIFAVLASVIFMLYCIKSRRFVDCITQWKEIWLDQGFWHILFSALLLVIMILWRPTNNNQRYAFVALMEANDDEEEEQLVNDAYGVKVRIHHPRAESPKRNTVDEDLKWLDEYVKTDNPLPVLDSDEELMNTRFEVSKMQ